MISVWFAITTFVLLILAFVLAIQFAITWRFKMLSDDLTQAATKLSASVDALTATVANQSGLSQAATQAVVSFTDAKTKVDAATTALGGTPPAA